MTLAEWMDDRGLRGTWVAEKLGVTPQTLSQYRTGKRRPSADAMKRIHDLTEGAVQPNDFHDFSRDGADGDAAAGAVA